MALGDLARALGDSMSAYLHELIPPLLETLKDQSAGSDIKVQSICSLADLAGATKAKFLDYVQEVTSFID
jgi:hypothetical protein